MRKLIASGKIRSRMIDGRRVISVASLRELVEGQSEGEAPTDIEVAAPSDTEADRVRGERGRFAKPEAT